MSSRLPADFHAQVVAAQVQLSRAGDAMLAVRAACPDHLSWRRLCWERFDMDPQSVERLMMRSVRRR